jgi:extradiol dioxygenase family protein
MKSRFHISLPCSDIEQTKNFYINVLGAELGRQKENWIDVNFFEHQITFIQSGNFKFTYKNYKLGDNILPSFHIGVILPVLIWQIMFRKLENSSVLHIDTTEYLIGSKGEHVSFFTKDPNGYIVEFKRFKDEASVFKV